VARVGGLDSQAGISPLQSYHEELASLAKTALYEKCDFGEERLRNPLLVALGALMNGSRRGSVRRIVTLNFDCILEWYALTYGLVPRIITDPPDLEGAEDVRIYHLHGFLGHPSVNLPDGGKLILSRRSVNKRLGDRNDPWFSLTQHLFQTSIALAVGMSYRTFEDTALAPHITVAHALRRSHEPVGFWFLADAPPSASEDRAMLDVGIVPLRMAKEEIPRVILKICQVAAKSL
jgi:hypothetical protein